MGWQIVAEAIEIAGLHFRIGQCADLRAQPGAGAGPGQHMGQHVVVDQGLDYTVMKIDQSGAATEHQRRAPIAVAGATKKIHLLGTRYLGLTGSGNKLQ